MKVIVGLGTRARNTSARDTTSAGGWSITSPTFGASTPGGRTATRASRRTICSANGGAPGQAADVHEPERRRAQTYLRRPFWAAATDLMVVVDEVALPIGRYRFRAEGSAGGHNGLKSDRGRAQESEVSAAPDRHSSRTRSGAADCSRLRARRIRQARRGMIRELLPR